MSNTLQKDQRGLVSFMVTIIMMLVISLIVIGFTQVTNRNRREQLDRQLSTQAFYAAESGVNAAIAKINVAISTPGGVMPQNTCSSVVVGGYPTSETNLSITPKVGYTCILVNPVVPSIITNASQQTSSVFPLNPVNSAGVSTNLTQLTFTWSTPQGVAASNFNCQSIGRFPKSSIAVPYMCAFGMLRVDLMYGASGGSAVELAPKTVTLFMQPLVTGISSPTISDFVSLGSPKGIIVGAQYDGASKKTYTAKVSLAGAAQTTQYYARITTLYRDSPRIVVGGSYLGTPVSFKDAQAIIDVTGKAQDVLRRVQVTVPIHQYDSIIPEGAVQSTTDVCKRFSTYPGSSFLPADGCSAL